MAKFFLPPAMVALAALLAVYFVAAAISGVVHNYSPVPFWDMWEDYVGFFLRLREGGWANWWAQHNEHRIVLGRLFFWLDLNLFHGSVVFLLAVNFFLVVVAALLFLSMARRLIAAEQCAAFRWFVSLAVVCLLFSWSQSENFTWGFQVPFFLAQLLPLLAFYLLYRCAVAQQHKNLLFAASASLGFASIGTMANGVLALPLLVVLAYLLRLGKGRIAALAVLAAAALFLYFRGYYAVSQHGSLMQAIAGQPLALAEYVLLYLGSPFHYAPGGGSRLVVALAGAVLVASTAYLLFRAVSARADNALPLTLLVFIGYVMATAFGTGGGRLIFGLDQALESRYTTPSLMAWCALLLLVADTCQRNARARLIVSALALLMVLVLLPHQESAWKKNNSYLYERRLAAVALELGAADSRQIDNVYPHSDVALLFSDGLRQLGLSVFGRPPLQGLRERIGQQVIALPSDSCLGQIDSVAAVPGDGRYLSIEGWIYRPGDDAVPRSVLLADDAGRLVGYGLVGKARRDVSRSRQFQSSRIGFRGYLLASHSSARIVVVGEEPACRFESELAGSDGRPE